MIFGFNEDTRKRISRFKKAKATKKMYDKLSKAEKKQFDTFSKREQTSRDNLRRDRDFNREVKQKRTSLFNFGRKIDREEARISKDETRAIGRYQKAGRGMQRALDREEKYLEKAEPRAIEKIKRAKRKVWRARAAAFGQVKQEAQQFGRQGQQQVDFSAEQESMASMFGQGEKIWGTQGEPVRMNHDLNPRRRGDTRTGELFGF